ncbi:hypothetical protein HDU77_000321 [Chytriomyces hyalinus]|nr:hypothetical protein HDU77_000321 [Chytriomyces hyalinus]
MTSENAAIQTSVAPTGHPDSQENRTMQITPDINSLPIELISCVFRWIPVQHVFKFRRLCRAVNESLLTTQFALLNMQLRSALLWTFAKQEYLTMTGQRNVEPIENLERYTVVEKVWCEKASWEAISSDFLKHGWHDAYKTRREYQGV